MNNHTEKPVDEPFLIIEGIDANLEPITHFETKNTSPTKIAESFIIDIPPSPKPQTQNKNMGTLFVLLGISGATMFSWIFNGVESPTNKVIGCIGASISLAGMFFLLKNRSAREMLPEEIDATNDRPHHH